MHTQTKKTKQNWLHGAMFLLLWNLWHYKHQTAFVLFSYFSTYNWVLGSTDPMNYIPPFFCAKAKLEEMETPDNMFTALESLAKKSKKE